MKIINGILISGDGNAVMLNKIERYYFYFVDVKLSETFTYASSRFYWRDFQYEILDGSRSLYDVELDGLNNKYSNNEMEFTFIVGMDYNSVSGTNYSTTIGEKNIRSTINKLETDLEQYKIDLAIDFVDHIAKKERKYTFK